jgi:hypothetical protein
MDQRGAGGLRRRSRRSRQVVLDHTTTVVGDTYVKGPPKWSQYSKCDRRFSPTKGGMRHVEALFKTLRYVILYLANRAYASSRPRGDFVSP